MPQTDWKNQVKDWISECNDTSPLLAVDFVHFFARAFKHTRVPEEAWFGAHTQELSLVTGGIFLAAAVSSGPDKGIWLLSKKKVPNAKGLTCSPVNSTQGSNAPLWWIHAESLESVGEYLKRPEIWESYAVASEEIFNSPRVSAPRNAQQIKRGKRRLSDLLKSKTVK